ncbi:HAMP domain-containing sensor histidine kinase [Streptomyces tropicalis]|uniref:histidine kinase n=1 Tax=Streptomyces tropicalis TaxID=3034234 RepID=A0ABT6A6R0_9ACTN|nr:HAMP domain-containing sensor histidine kinase [Streptomyces tropicalis]MDF3300327.1 HAMP domain-containing sensor histidine kinase [Streptomyces tropicalis]
MRNAVRRLRSLPLRSRLALLVAAAVAFAVAAVSVTCWFIVQNRLYNEVDNRLGNANTHQLLDDTPYVTALLASCPVGPAGDSAGRPSYFYMQLVTSQGRSCVLPQSEGVVRVTPTDRRIAARPDLSIRTFHNSTDSAGNNVRVMVVAIPLQGGPDAQPYPGAVFTLGLSLKDTEKTLDGLALLLLLVSGVGVIGAGAAGLAVARAGLRPVDELTEAVEHVARTEDLTIRIPVADDTEDEIARLSRSFNSMTSALASSRDLQQQLIADAGHELRTPLTSLRTNIELLTRSEETGRPLPESDRKALLASVKAQVTELASLIGDLQELSRAEAQRGERVQVVAFQDTVEEALRRARLRGPELTITAALSPWFVRAEPAALERAVVNILDNAVKFSPEGGTVEVVLDAGVLTVRDHGPGIPADELPHVFDRFWRSPSARALPGSGLGLSIVARTVQHAGGRVALAPADGGGTVATVSLPGAPTPPPERP